MKSTGQPTANPTDFEGIVENALRDTDLQPQNIPPLALYMDQILTLFNETLAKNCRRPEDTPLTKTMINNYSKEKLLTPVQGKKYSREQMMQLLCVLVLKQTLSLADIRALMLAEDTELEFERAYGESLKAKEGLKAPLGEIVKKVRDDFSDMGDREKNLATVLVLSAAATYLQRICEGIIDAQQ